jgi:serine/threonine-protein kinase
MSSSRPISTEVTVPGAPRGLERLQVRDADAGGVVASADSAAEREVLRERLALLMSVSFVTSAVFYTAQSTIAGFALPGQKVPAGFLPEVRCQFFFLGAIAILLTAWLVARRRGLSFRALLRVDAAATVATCWACALMALDTPVSWRLDLVSLLILNAVLFSRAALVPSTPGRTAWISAAAAAPVPAVAFLLLSGNMLSNVKPIVPVVHDVLWSAFAVALSTLVSFITFRLRRSVARARRLGQYTLVEKIGEGGMGIVYRAHHEMLARPTAIKLLPPEKAGEASIKRFEREVQLTSQLTSPHTVSVYDFGRTPEGVFYYVMEYLDGVDLEQLVRREGPMPPGRAVAILDQVCRALAEAHEVGLIHRDVKPANILIGVRGGVPDFVKVVDFGLVREVSPRDGKITREDVVPGTPHYLAPEAIRDTRSVDPRSDLYAVGAVAYYLLTGTPVFAGRSALEVLDQHLNAAPVPPSRKLGRPLPPKLEAVVLACLEKDPERRPASARDLAGRLAACDDVPAWSEAEARLWWVGRKTA